MFHLLIVDDEITVVNSLAYDIHWEELNISEVYRANNAHQAVECMKKNRVDIVITDIQMPEMTGLELAHLIKTQWPCSRMIFISGFDNFVYAQKAIDLGVESYIVKPVRHEMVKEVVARTVQEMEQELVRTQTLENTERRLEETLPILQERYLNAWIVQGSLQTEVILQKLGQCGVTLEEGSSAFFILIKADLFDNNQAAVTEGVYEVILQNIIKEILLKGEQAALFCDSDGNQIVLVSRSIIDELNEIYNYTQCMAEAFQLSVSRSLGYQISVFWSPIVGLDQLHAAYKKMIEKARRSMLYSGGLIMGPEKEEKGLRHEYLNRLYAFPPFSTLIESLQKEKALTRIEEIFDEVDERISNDNLLGIYLSVSSALLTDSVKRGAAMESWAGEELSNYFYNFERIKSVQELKAWCKKAICRFMDYILTQERKSTNYVIEQAKKIILEHFHHEITLDEIASRLYIHPNHLSRLFKEIEGLSITDYRIMCRVEKAKELLKKPGIKVYEVAELVGCGSVTSLNRIFKNGTGLSPKEFQSQP